MCAPIITLLSDFGLQDEYVSVMKGVILEICPAARLIDISHLIAPHDLRSASFLLYASCNYFPPGTIHLAVVDPGVGTARKAVAIKAGAFFFVGPDNGLFSLVLKKQTAWEARCLENPQLRRNPVSNTFHGRDIFAPAAAHLARGVPFHALGTPCGLIPAPWVEPDVEKDTVKGELIHIDRFGNAITNVAIDVLEKKAPAEKWTLLAQNYSLPILKTYGSVKKGLPLALVGSTGFIEIALNQGSAAATLKLRPATPVAFRLAHSPH